MLRKPKEHGLDQVQILRVYSDLEKPLNSQNMFAFFPVSKNNTVWQCPKKHLPLCKESLRHGLWSMACSTELPAPDSGAWSLRRRHCGLQETG